MGCRPGFVCLSLLVVGLEAQVLATRSLPSGEIPGTCRHGIWVGINAPVVAVFVPDMRAASVPPPEAYDSLLTGRRYFLQMTEDAEIAMRFSQ